MYSTRSDSIGDITRRDNNAKVDYRGSGYPRRYSINLYNRHSRGYLRSYNTECMAGDTGKKWKKARNGVIETPK